MVSPTHKETSVAVLVAHKPCGTFNIPQSLAPCSYRLVFSHGYDETLVAITREQFDVTLIDLDLNGPEMIAQARAMDCINCYTPTIALGDKLNPSLRSHLIALGFDDCILKPLTRNTLTETINFWLNPDYLPAYMDSIHTLLAKCRHNRSLVQKIYGMMFDELPSQMHEIEAAINSGSIKNAFDPTHKLNGSAKICCLEKIAQAAANLERCIVESRLADIERHLSALRRSIVYFLAQKEAIMLHLDQC